MSFGALGVLWLLSVASFPCAAAGSQPLTAIMLVAQHDVKDPFFAHSIVLVLNNLGPAPAGVIVNRPTSLTVAKLFPKLKRLERLPARVYFGGPVEPRAIWFVFRAAQEPPHAFRACPGVYLSTDPRLLRRLLRRRDPMRGLRIFVGHAGWAPGQLQNEISRGDWKLEQAAPDIIFGNRADYPWPAPPSGGRSS